MEREELLKKSYENWISFLMNMHGINREKAIYIMNEILTRDN